MCGGRVPHRRRAVGGDEDGGRRHLGFPPQDPDELEAVAVVEMVIGDDDLRRSLVGPDDLPARPARSDAVQHLAAPAGRAAGACPRGSRVRCRSPARAGRPATSPAGLRRPRRAAAAGSAATTGTSTRNTDPRPGSECRVTGWLEHAADALDDREAEPEAARDLGALVEALELAEHDASASRAECRGPYPRPRESRCAPRRRAPTSTRPVGVYLMALETRFCSRRRSRRRSERTVSEDGTKVRSRPFSRAIGSNSRCSWRNNSSMRKLDHCGFMAPVSRREMSSSAVRISSTASSEASMFSASVASPASLVALDERSRVEPRGIERLQDVVAGGGEKARLRDVGLVGLGLGASSAPR